MVRRRGLFADRSLVLNIPFECRGLFLETMQENPIGSIDTVTIVEKFVRGVLIGLA